MYITAEHQFKANETVQAILKYYNNNNMTEDELYLARIYFFAENGFKSRNAGDVVKVPILEQYQKE